MNYFTRALDRFRDSRTSSVAKRVAVTVGGSAWQTLSEVYISSVRPLTAVAPEQVTYNGVTTRPYRVLDPYVPGSLPPNRGGHWNPEAYESGLVDALGKTVESGDDVAVIGAGLGVTAVVAGWNCGENGSVRCYEGDRSVIDHLLWTPLLNGVDRWVTVEHAIVSNSQGLRGGGDGDGAATVAPEDLPACDILEMDCEGAEVEILDRLSIRPRAIVVETHGNTEQVQASLEEMGYHIESKALAETGPYEEMCVREGVYVLTATRD